MVVDFEGAIHRRKEVDLRVRTAMNRTVTISRKKRRISRMNPTRKVKRLWELRPEKNFHSTKIVWEPAAGMPIKIARKNNTPRRLTRRHVIHYKQYHLPLYIVINNRVEQNLNLFINNLDITIEYLLYK